LRQNTSHDQRPANSLLSEMSTSGHDTKARNSSKHLVHKYRNLHEQSLLPFRHATSANFRYNLPHNLIVSSGQHGSTAAQPRSRTSASHVTACHIISQASSSHTRPSSTAYCHTLACPGRKRSKARTDTNHRSSSRSRETKGIPAGRWVERKVSGPRGRVGRYLCYAASSQKQAHERV
jgi:hypothetical protein